MTNFLHPLKSVQAHRYLAPFQIAPKDIPNFTCKECLKCLCGHIRMKAKRSLHRLSNCWAHGAVPCASLPCPAVCSDHATWRFTKFMIKKSWAVHPAAAPWQADAKRRERVNRVCQSQPCNLAGMKTQVSSLPTRTESLLTVWNIDTLQVI